MYYNHCSVGNYQYNHTNIKSSTHIVNSSFYRLLYSYIGLALISELDFNSGMYSKIVWTLGSRALKPDSIELR